MNIYEDTHFAVYFGDKSNSCESKLLLGKKKENILSSYKLSLNIKEIIFLEQAHSNKGAYINHSNLSYFHHNRVVGDYLITDKVCIGLGVYTADCLPIVLYDNQNNAIGICHAGRVGTLKGVVCRVLEQMSNCFGTKPKDLKIFFGPSAKACCYEISYDIYKDIAQNINSFNSSQARPKADIIFEKDSKFFFNIGQYNKELLLDLNVPQACFVQDFNKCTICDLSFCSYRREGKTSSRQLTIVYLKA